MARYIDADELCDSLLKSYNRLFDIYKGAKDNDAATLCEAQLCTFMECFLRTKTQPTADVVEVKHARWIVSEFCGGNRIGFCTECEVENRIDNYCPNCGAKMDGGVNDG